MYIIKNNYLKYTIYKINYRNVDIITYDIIMIYHDINWYIFSVIFYYNIYTNVISFILLFISN